MRLGGKGGEGVSGYGNTVSYTDTTPYEYMLLESCSSICFTLAEEFSLKKPCFEVDLCGVSVIVMPGGLQLEGRNHIGSSSCTSKGDVGPWFRVVLF